MFFTPVSNKALVSNPSQTFQRVRKPLNVGNINGHKVLSKNAK